jgi:hypothetical protein
MIKGNKSIERRLSIRMEHFFRGLLSILREVILLTVLYHHHHQQQQPNLVTKSGASTLVPCFDFEENGWSVHANDVAAGRGRTRAAHFATQGTV